MTTEIIFAALSALAVAAFGYLMTMITELKTENKKLKTENELIRGYIVQLATAIKYTDSISDNSELHKAADLIIEKLDGRG